MKKRRPNTYPNATLKKIPLFFKSGTLFLYGHFPIKITGAKTKNPHAKRRPILIGRRFTQLKKYEYLLNQEIGSKISVTFSTLVV